MTGWMTPAPAPAPAPAPSPVAAAPAPAAGPTHGKVSGRVVDEKTGVGIPEARLVFGGGGRLLSEPSGVYESYPLEAGPVGVQVEAQDYEAFSTSVEVAGGAVTPLDVRLKPKAQRGPALKIRVVNEKEEPLSSQVTLTDARGRDISVSMANGSGQQELSPGRYHMVARAEGYLLGGRTVSMESASRTESIQLKMEAKKRLATLNKSKIELKLPIKFDQNKAKLSLASLILLDEVVDVILRHPQAGKLRVEGHSDKSENAKVAQQRAEAVAEYLTANGVPAERLLVLGVGSGWPLGPSGSEAGRAKNRRVEFVFEGGGSP